MNGITKAIRDAGAEILLELWERLDADLSEKDRVAVATAITKGLDVGASRGFAEAAAQLIERGVPVDVHDTSPPMEDEWAEHYGGEGET